MRCKYCNVELYGDNNICPLCHNKIEENNNEELKKPYYPPKQKHKKNIYIYKINSFYIILSLAIFLICITINYLTSTNILWCYMVGIVLFYGYILFRHTIQSHSGVGSKIFIQGLSIWAVLAVFNTQIDSDLFIFNYALPIIIALSIIVQVICLLILFKKDRSLFLSTITLSICGFLPIILYGIKISNILLPSLLTAVLSSIVIITTFILGYKDIKNQAKRLFHN